MRDTYYVRRRGVHVLWRAARECQVGADARYAVVLTDLTQREQRLLDDIPSEGAAPRLVSVEQLARQRKVAVPRARALVRHLADHGLLLAVADTDTDLAAESPPVPSPDREHAGLHALLSDPAQSQTAADDAAVRTARVAVVNETSHGTLALLVARQLAAGGVGAVELRDGEHVVRSDLGLGGYPAAALGQVRGQAAIALLREDQPRVGLAAGGTPDLVVLLESRAAIPWRSSGLQRQDISHLSIVVRDLDVVVGPLVRPGLDPCLRCLDLARCQVDPAWPALATQLSGLATPRLPAGVLFAAASTAALEVVAALRTGLEPQPGSLHATTLEIGVTRQGVRRGWDPHRACGCGSRPVPAVEPG